MSRGTGESKWATSNVSPYRPRQASQFNRQDYSHAPPPSSYNDSKPSKLFTQPIGFVKSNEGLPSTISLGRTPGPVHEANASKPQPAPSETLIPDYTPTSVTVTAPAFSNGTNLGSPNRAQQRLAQVSASLSPTSITAPSSKELTLADSKWASAGIGFERRSTTQEREEQRRRARQEREELLQKRIRENAVRSASSGLPDSPVTPAIGSSPIATPTSSSSRTTLFGSVVPQNDQTTQPAVTTPVKTVAKVEVSSTSSPLAERFTAKPTVAPPAKIVSIAESINTSTPLVEPAAEKPTVARPVKTVAFAEAPSTSAPPTESTAEPLRRKKKVSTVRIAGPAGPSPLPSQATEHKSPMTTPTADVMTPLVNGVKNLGLSDGTTLPSPASPAHNSRIADIKPVNDPGLSNGITPPPPAGLAQVSRRADVKPSAAPGLLSSPEAIFKKMGGNISKYGRPSASTTSSKQVAIEPTEDREHLTHFASWGKPAVRASGSAQVRSVILTGLPANTTITEVAGLVWGGNLDRVDFTPGSGRARVRFLKGNDCQKYYAATANGIVHPREKTTVLVELGQEIEPVPGRLQEAVDIHGASRCVRSIGVDADRTYDFLKRRAEGQGTARKILEMRQYPFGSTKARTVEWQFDCIEAAQSFAMELRRDRDFEHTNVQFAEDPCAPAQGPHYP